MPADPVDESFESGAWQTNWTGEEAAHPSDQIVVQTSVVRSGFGHACRFREKPGDVWTGNNTVRALLNKTNSAETVGQTHYWWNSIFLPNSGGESITHDNLLWELHNPSSLYNLNQGVLAPYGLLFRSSNGVLRIVTGNLTVGSGYAHFEPAIAIPALTPWPKGQWVDYIFAIQPISESSGNVKLWIDTTGTGTFTEGSPDVSRTGIPTAQFCNSANVHNVTYYTEDGLYTGANSISSTDTAYQIGGGRESTFAAAVARLHGSAPPVPPNPINTILPVISGVDEVGGTLTVSDGTWSGSPTSFEYQWLRDQKGNNSYSNIPGATANAYVLTSQDDKSHVTCRVTAIN